MIQQKFNNRLIYLFLIPVVFVFAFSLVSHSDTSSVGPFI